MQGPEPHIPSTTKAFLAALCFLGLPQAQLTCYQASLGHDKRFSKNRRRDSLDDYVVCASLMLHFTAALSLPSTAPLLQFSLSALTMELVINTLVLPQYAGATPEPFSTGPSGEALGCIC